VKILPHAELCSPCKEIQFEAISTNEKDALARRQEQEDSTPEHSKHVADDTAVISFHGPMTKDDRSSGLEKRQQTHVPKVGDTARVVDALVGLRHRRRFHNVAAGPGGKSYWAEPRVCKKQGWTAAKDRELSHDDSGFSHANLRPQDK
jgi:hypothetical protein